MLHCLKSMGLLIVPGTVFAGLSLAQPTVTALENYYSHMLPGLPNYGIAQGSIVNITGTDLASGATPLQSVPLQSTLNGVSVKVTVGGTVVPLILYSIAPTQITAILPSRTPVGTGQLTVTNGTQTSSSFPIQVVQSAFGILSLNGGGNGAAALFDTSYHFLTFTNAANAGDYVTLWGTGLGPVQGDETVAQTPLNLIALPIEVDIGGVPATVAYHGRSAYPGVDQINVVVPAGLQGCFVSVVVKTGNLYSNFASIPVALSGRTCSDANVGLSTSLIETLSSLPSFSAGTLNFLTTGAGSQFRRITNTNLSATTLFSGPSLGSCAVDNLNNQGTVQSTDLNAATAIDAGPSIGITGPSGSISLNNNNNFYFSQISPGFVPAAGGTFHINNGQGGPDVGAFALTLTLPPPLTWTNQASITTVNRAQGVTVTWSGGDSNSYVRISGSTSSTTAPMVGAVFNCTAPIAAKTFTVPASVLLQLPPGSSTLGLGNAPNTLVFQVTSGPKLDFGLASTSWRFSTNVVYQ